MVFFRSVTC